MVMFYHPGARGKDKRNMAAPNEAITMRLYLVREMLSDAVGSVVSTFPFARMRTILAIDHAVELLLSTLLPELGVAVNRDWNLPKMLAELSRWKPALQSHVTPMERMRRLRDRVQHDGIVPSSEDARQMLAHAEVFARDAVREVTGKELEEFSLVSLVGDEEARTYLQASTEALRGHDYPAAIIKAAIGFAIARLNYRKRDWRHRFWAEEMTERILKAVEQATEQAAADAVQYTQVQAFGTYVHRLNWNLETGDVHRHLEEVLGHIEAARYGLDVGRYSRFMELIPKVFWTLNDATPKWHVPDGWAPSQEEAVFVVDYAVAALMQMDRSAHEAARIAR